MSTPRAETLRRLLLDAKQTNNGQLTQELWLSVTQRFLDDNWTNRKAKVAPTTSTGVGSSDTEWIVYLESLPHLKGIDVRKEIGKCQFWCSVNNRKPTRRMVANWLNSDRCERSLNYNAQGQSSFAPKAPVGPQEPVGWREEFPESIYKTWADMPADTRRHVAEAMRKLA